MRDGDADALTNAVAQATGDGDVIQVYPGTYDLSGMPMTTSVWNSAGTYCDTVGVGLKITMKNGALLGMGERPEDTAIVCGGSNDAVRVMTFAGACVVSNLTISGGYVHHAGAWSVGAVCDDSNRGWAKFTDCLFTNNFAKRAGVLAKIKNPIVRCRFVDNMTRALHSNGGLTVRDSYFETGSYIVLDYDGASFSNCVFTGCLGQILNTPVSNAKRVAIDCVFTNNAATKLFASSYLTNCLIACNGTLSGMQLADGGEFYNCDINSNTGGVLIANAAFYRCKLRDNRGGNDWHAETPLLNSCKFYSSLLQGNAGPSGHTSMGVFAKNTSFYNCTVVSNYYRGSVGSYSITYGSSAVAVNTVFDGNGLYTYNKGEHYQTNELTIVSCQDFSAKNMPKAMTNCFWTAQTGTVTNEFPDCGLKESADFCFADPAKGDWTLRKSSVLFDAGWSDAAYLEDVGAKDLAGVKRVRGAAIDIGAYEIDVKPGMVFIIR